MLQPLSKPTIRLATPEMSRKRSLATLSEPESTCSDLPSAKKTRRNSFLGLPTLPHTPPDSIASSPAILPYGEPPRHIKAVSCLLTQYRYLFQ